MYGGYGPGMGLGLVDVVDIEFWNGEKEKTVHI